MQNHSGSAFSVSNMQNQAYPESHTVYKNQLPVIQCDFKGRGGSAFSDYNMLILIILCDFLGRACSAMLIQILQNTYGWGTNAEPPILCFLTMRPSCILMQNMIMM